MPEPDKRLTEQYELVIEPAPGHTQTQQVKGAFS